MKKIIIFLIVGFCFLNAKIITDSLGRKVEIPNDIKKVVAIGPGALRLVVYMREQHKIIGIEKKEKKYIYARPYILANLWMLKLPIIGMGGPNPNPNLETLIKLKPDIIVAGYISKSTANTISKKTNIPLVVVDYGNIGTFANKQFFQSLKILGEVFNKQKRAIQIKHFIENMNMDFKGLNTNKTAYIGATAFKGIHGITSSMSIFPPFKMLGIKNIIKTKAKSQIFVSKEFLYNSNPDFVFIDESGMKMLNKNLPLLFHMSAYKQNKAYGILPYNHYMTNIASAYADTYFIGSVVYPKKIKFSTKKIGDIYKFFVGKDCYLEMSKFFGGYKNLKELIGK